MDTVIWDDTITLSGIEPTATYIFSMDAIEVPVNDQIATSAEVGKIVVVSCDRLRKDGADISEGLSWEKTVIDTMNQVTHRKLIREKYFWSDLMLISFGREGLLIIKTNNRIPNNKHTVSLVFSSDTLEKSGHECAEQLVNHLRSYCAEYDCSWFVSSDAISEEFIQGCTDFIKVLRSEDESSSGVFLNQITIEKLTDILSEEITNGEGRETHEIISGCIESLGPLSAVVRVSNCAVPIYDAEWKIISRESNQWTQEELSSLASGKLDDIHHILDIPFPLLVIGNLSVIERTEIEHYNSVINQIETYVNQENQSRPLSIAVFGSPGSGKSFGVKEIVKSRVKNHEFITVNLSQFDTPKISSLVHSMREIQNTIIAGKIPVVFFDEFDTHSFSWLQYFLVPMEDGCFYSDGKSIPLGKCIFVFAGGTNSSFREFADKATSETAKNMKLPDFVSRLSGYIDVSGINYSGENDSYANLIARTKRALIICNLIFRLGIDMNNVDENIIKVLLLVNKFQNDARSLRTIIGLFSKPDGTPRIRYSNMPSNAQLSLHVDAHKFHDSYKELTTSGEIDFICIRRLCKIRGKKWDVLEQREKKAIEEEYVHLMNKIKEKEPDIIVNIQNESIELSKGSTCYEGGKEPSDEARNDIHFLTCDFDEYNDLVNDLFKVSLRAKKYYADNGIYLTIPII